MIVPHRLQPTSRVVSNGRCGKISHYEPDELAYVIWDDQTVSKIRAEELQPEREDPMSHDFLNGCHSKPKTLADLKVGDCFIFFPDDGDDSGHGGFKGGSRLFVKIEPYHPGEPYHESYRNTCREYERPDVINSMPLRSYVIQVHGIKAN